MAPAKKAAKLVDVDDIDLLGKAKDAKKLAQYVEQQGKAAVPFLERAFAEGSVDVRHAAALGLGKVAPALGEQLVVKALDALGKKPSKKELAALIACLAAIGTESAVDAVVARVPPVALDTARLADEVLGALLARVPARLADRKLDGDGITDVTSAYELPASAARPRVPRVVARTVLLAIIDDERAPLWLRKDACNTLWSSGADDAETRAAVIERRALAVMPVDIVVAASMAGDPAAAYERMAPQYRAGGIARNRITEALTPASDRRWVKLALEVVDVDAAQGTLALAQLGAVDALLQLAEMEPFDDTTKCALAALGRTQGEPRAGAVLLRWLARPEGAAVAPLILTALSTCGDGACIAPLEKLLVDAGARAGFCRHAIDSIKARTG